VQIPVPVLVYIGNTGTDLCFTATMICFFFLFNFFLGTCGVLESCIKAEIPARDEAILPSCRVPFPYCTLFCLFLKLRCVPLMFFDNICQIYFRKIWEPSRTMGEELGARPKVKELMPDYRKLKLMPFRRRDVLPCNCRFRP
jgi:hypothetical protein